MVEKILKIEQAPWSEEAAAMLATTLRGAPCIGVEDYRIEIERKPETTKLFRISTEAGETVAFVVLCIHMYQRGAEGVLLAAAGRLRGVRLYSQVLPALERMFTGVLCFRVDSCRAGAIKYLRAAGYQPTHITMRKAASAPAIVRGAP